MDVTDDTLAIGVDLGATKIATALVDRAGRVIASRQIPTRPSDGAASACDRMAVEIGALLDVAWASRPSASREARERRPSHVLGVGVGVPGVVDSERGIFRGAVNLGWDEVRLAEEIGASIGGEIPVVIENDA